MLFDDVELTAAEVARLARQARPLVQSRGRWVEVDRVDLEQAAAALAEREAITQLTGAEILRHSIGLDGSGPARRRRRPGQQLGDRHPPARRRRRRPRRSPSRRASSASCARTRPRRSAWIGFLDAAELGGCLALDMGLGKTPTVLAHLARTAGDATPALVIAPAAVVGNWAAEAARFVPGLRVVVHHGASRSSADAAGRPRSPAPTSSSPPTPPPSATSTRSPTVTWGRIVLDEAQAIKNPASETAQQLRRIPARTRLALTGTPIENGLGDLWAILDFTNPGLVGSRPAFIAQMSGDGEAALRALNGILLFRRTKSEPEVAAELPDKIDELDHCTMTAEQIGLYQAVLDDLVVGVADAESRRRTQEGRDPRRDHRPQADLQPPGRVPRRRPAARRPIRASSPDSRRSSSRCSPPASGCWCSPTSRRGAGASPSTSPRSPGLPIACYDGSLARGARDRLVAEFQDGKGPGALVLSLKAGGTGLNLTAANHVVLYDRWWNPAVEDQARDRAWRIGQQRTVISHRLVCPGTVDERVEEVVAGKRHIANLVLPKSSSIADLDTDQLRLALGLRPDELLTRGRRDEPAAGIRRERLAGEQAVAQPRARRAEPARRSTAAQPAQPTPEAGPSGGHLGHTGRSSRGRADRDPERGRRAGPLVGRRPVDRREHRARPLRRRRRGAHGRHRPRPGAQRRRPRRPGLTFRRSLVRGRGVLATAPSGVREGAVAPLASATGQHAGPPPRAGCDRARSRPRRARSCADAHRSAVLVRGSRNLTAAGG